MENKVIKKMKKTLNRKKIIQLRITKFYKIVKKEYKMIKFLIKNLEICYKMQNMTRYFQFFIFLVNAESKILKLQLKIIIIFVKSQ